MEMAVQHQENHPCHCATHFQARWALVVGYVVHAQSCLKYIECTLVVMSFVDHYSAVYQCEIPFASGYYGHYLGHYLSGNAMMYNNTQDERILVKGRSIVDGLRKVADAWTASKVPNSKGYIFPYYPDVFGIMETRCGMPGPVVDYTVPYYTLHKIMAGLLDQAELAHNADARVLVIGLADWTVARVAQTLQVCLFELD
eukprot:m.912655 g.912655  ORF g.912655 m.912655 type:complete len:199 (+) comp23727_c0_seq23:422-1018(+)